MSFSSDACDHFMNLRAPLDIDGLAPDCSNSTVNALESLQSCAKLARTKLSTSWCMGSVWSYCQGGQLLWSIESQMRGQGNHSNHSVPRATIQAQHYSNHIYRETAVLTQKLVLWGIFWDWVQPTRRRTARVWAPRFHRYLLFNVIFKHHKNLSLSIADQFSSVWWYLAQMA